MSDSETATAAPAAPSHAELERAIASVPGVVEAHVSLVEETNKSRLRIRLANDEDAEAVSWAIAATLRERFGIVLDPAQIRPRTPDTSEEGGAQGPPAAGGRIELSEAARALFDEALDEAEAGAQTGAQQTDAQQTGDEVERPDHSAAAEGTEVDPAPGSAAAEGGELAGGTLEVEGDQGRAAGESLAAPAPGDTPAGPDAVAPRAGAGPDAAPTATPGVLTADLRTRREEARARIHHLDTQVDVSAVQVTATLSFGPRRVTGTASSVPTQQGILRAVAEATLSALRALTGDRLVAGVDKVSASVGGDPPIATVLLSMLTERGDEALLGSSLVRQDPERAVMRATLDACNRRVEPWLEVELAS